MPEPEIRFSNGATYERAMGVWSRLAGDVFLDWLAPSTGLRWLDVGCGNGALTSLLAERFAPSALHGIDPSEGQLAFARTRPTLQAASFQQAGAMALPFPDNSFDAAVMGLVVFFIPDPSKGIAEMARVVSAGGLVATYAWDMLGGGFPQNVLQVEMRKMNISFPLPPSNDASHMSNLEALWAGAGLSEVETREITVERTFADFEDFWATCLLGSTTGAAIADLQTADVELLQSRVRARLKTREDGQVVCGARANAIKGRVASR
jgi:SAM-dependent methyltransferase